MKRLMLAGLIVSMTQVMPARAAEHSAPFLGSWALDVTHSQIPPEARPKSVVITYKDAPGQLQYTAYFRNWNAEAQLAAESLKFTPPAGAKKVDFAVPATPSAGSNP